LQGAGEFEIADPLAAVEIDDFVRRRLIQARDVATREILDVDELPGLASVAVNDDRLVVEQRADEGRRDRLRRGTLPERNAVAHDRVAHAIEPLVVPAEQLRGYLR